MWSGKDAAVNEVSMSEAGLPSPEAREAALYARFRELGISWKTHEHAAVFTVEEAAALYAQQPGGHTKISF